MVRDPAPERTGQPVQQPVHRDRQHQRGHAERYDDIVHVIGLRHGVELRGDHQSAEGQHGHHQIDHIERWLTQHLPRRQVDGRSVNFGSDFG